MEFLSVLIPAFNEEKRIARTLAGVISYLKNKSYRWEIVIVDDGSSDGTLEAAISSGARIRIVSHKINLGKGAAVKTGVLEALGGYILVIDADSSTPIEEFDRFEASISSGARIVIGSRKTPGAVIEKHQPFFRELLGRMFTALGNIILGTRVSDFTCGFKCFEASAAKKICRNQKITGWSYDAEILFLAFKFGFSVTEVPVHWKNDPNTKVRLARDVITSLAGLIKIRLNNAAGMYGE